MSSLCPKKKEDHSEEQKKEEKEEEQAVTEMIPSVVRATLVTT
jgi:hypothetical protein